MAVSLNIDKTGIAPRTVNPGDLVTYNIFIFNNGDMTANGVSVSDVFPADLTGFTLLNSIPLGAATSANGFGSIVGSSFIDDQLVLDQAEGVFYQIQATVSAAAVDMTTISNTADAVDVTDAMTAVTDTDTSFFVEVPPGPDLAVTKDPAGAPGSIEVLQGDPVTYTLFASYEGTTAATGVTVTDVFPVELDPMSVMGMATDNPNVGGEDGSIVGGTAIVDDGISIPPGETITYVITGTVDAAAPFATTLFNVATIEGVTDPVEMDLTNNTYTNDVYFIGTDVDLVVEKTAVGGGTILPGEFVDYEIVISNVGTQDAENVEIMDAFPAGLVNAQWTIFDGGGMEIASGMGDINEAGITILSGATFTIQVSAQADCDLTSGSTIHNTASAFDAVVTDETPADNVDDDSSFSIANSSPGVSISGGGLLFSGTPFDDLMIGTEIGQRMNGNFGNDTIFGSGGIDEINGNGGNDMLIGGSGDDRMSGGTGNDTLDGACTTYGVGQIDRLTGNSGADYFVLGDTFSSFYLGNGTDDYAYITDFNGGGFFGDKLVLNGSIGDYTFVPGFVVDGIVGQGIFQGGDLVAILQQSFATPGDLVFV
jgi:uncharacterized repeat protein (TIGR01451 family)